MIVLIPLYFMDETIEGLSQVKVAIGLMLIVSLVLNILFAPPFLRQTRNPIHKTGKPARSFYFFCYSATGWIIKHKRIVLAGSLLILGILVCFAFTLKKDLTFSLEEDTVFAHVEFDSGTDISFVDEITTVFSAQVRRIPGVSRVQSASKPGVADLTVAFDSKKIPKATLSGSSKNWGKRFRADSSTSRKKRVQRKGKSRSPITCAGISTVLWP